MKITLSETKYLKESISIISELIQEAKFSLTKDSLKMIAMDPANVAMVIFEMFSSNFTEYELKEDTEFTINLSYLKQIIKRASANDTLTLELEDGKLNIHINGRSKRTFTLSTINSEEKEQKIPDLNFGVTITSPCEILGDVVEDSSVISADAITFLAEDKKLSFIAESDLNKVKIDTPESEEIKIIKNEEDTIKAKYSIEYLKKMVTGSKLTDRVKIMFSTNYPLKLEYSVIDKVQIAFILAPRVEED